MRLSLWFGFTVDEAFANKKISAIWQIAKPETQCISHIQKKLNLTLNHILIIEPVGLN